MEPYEIQKTSLEEACEGIKGFIEKMKEESPANSLVEATAFTKGHDGTLSENREGPF